MSTQMPEVLVVGSVNMDLSVKVGRIPSPGETVLARDAVRSPGGKGGNQAVAAARAGGARVGMIGAVGTDPDGQVLRDALAADGIDVAGLETVEGSSGLALISVDDSAENAIVVVPGANAEVSARTADAQERLAGASVILAQLEIPLETILHAAASRGEDSIFLLNAAPSQELPDALLTAIDVLVVNEHEALEVGGADDLDAAVRRLLDQVATVIVTLGGAGVQLHRRGREMHALPAFPVDAVDTTSAGDTFCGVLAARLASDTGIDEALHAASAAAALTVTRPGAQESIPTEEDVTSFLDQHHPTTYGEAS